MDDISLVGQVVGGYRIERELGRGGMGVVYLAMHTRIGQRAAIKVLSGRLVGDRVHHSRFLEEARANCQVQHDGFVKIFDFGNLDCGRPYILMEYLEAASLRSRLVPPGQRMGLDEVLRVTGQIADALASAHQGGIVHGDLKPENVIPIGDSLVPGGVRCKVLDFGIARSFDASITSPASLDGLSASSAASPQAYCGFGTPRYMSPEHFQPASMLTDRSDVYSLGVMLYEMLCGQPPFFGDVQRLMLQHVFQEAASPGRLRAGLPDEVCQLCLAMLAKPPSMRPSMSDVATAVGRYSANNPSELAPLSLPSPAPSHGMRLAWLPLVLCVWAFAKMILFSHSVPGSSVPPKWRLGMPFGMALLPGGRMTMGSLPDEHPRNLEEAITRWHCDGCTPELFARETARRVILSPFYLDKVEVTNRQYAAWLNKLGARAQVDRWNRYVRFKSLLLLDLNEGLAPSGITYQGGVFQVRPDMEERPVVYVSWDGARLYCEQQSKRLPTEAEWEYAASQGGQWRFPWGDQAPRCEGVAIGHGEEGHLCSGKPGPAPVATMEQDQTPDGVSDLAGNVAEWVLDEFRATLPSCGLLPCQDPLVSTVSPNTSERSLRVVRGGSSFRSIDTARAASRSKGWRDETVGDTGFRCAWPTQKDGLYPGGSRCTSRSGDCL